MPYDLTHGVALAAGPPPIATLVTAPFLHGSAVHLLANMLVLVAVGPAIERLTGHGRFVAFYLACAAFANLAYASVRPLDHVPSIGASGAIAGVLGAYVVRFPLAHVWGVPVALLIAAWAVAQVVHGFASVAPQALSERGGIAYFAHVGGLLAGVFGIGAFVRRPSRGAS